MGILRKKRRAHLRVNTFPLQLHLAAEQASEQLTVVITRFLELRHADVDSLFNLVESMVDEELHESHLLSTYLYRCVISDESVEYQRKIVLRSLERYASKRTSQRKTPKRDKLLRNLRNEGLSFKAIAERITGCTLYMCWYNTVQNDIVEAEYCSITL